MNISEQPILDALLANVNSLDISTPTKEVTLLKFCPTDNIGLTVSYTLTNANSSDSSSSAADTGVTVADTCDGTSDRGAAAPAATNSEDIPSDANVAVFIAAVEPHGVAAHDGRLRAGDQILQVNGLDVCTRLETEEALFDDTAASVTLLVSRCLFGSALTVAQYQALTGASAADAASYAATALLDQHATLTPARVASYQQYVSALAANVRKARLYVQNLHQMEHMEQHLVKQQKHPQRQPPLPPQPTAPPVLSAAPQPAPLLSPPLGLPPMQSEWPQLPPTEWPLLMPSDLLQFMPTAEWSPLLAACPGAAVAESRAAEWDDVRLDHRYIRQHLASVTQELCALDTRIENALLHKAGGGFWRWIQ